MEILPEWIQDFTMSYMTAWYDPDRQLGDALYAPLTYQQMVHSVAQLGALYENRPVPQLETSQQINDRPYDWYYTQNDTGTYLSLIHILYNIIDKLNNKNIIFNKEERKI